jgi:hypothetical protein
MVTSVSAEAVRPTQSNKPEQELIGRSDMAESQGQTNEKKKKKINCLPAGGSIPCYA